MIPFASTPFPFRSECGSTIVMMRSLLDVLRWLSCILLIASGFLCLKGTLLRSWVGLFTILWLIASISLVIVGVLGLTYRRQSSHSGQLRWTFGFLGLILLPSILVSLMVLFPPGGGPGFGGANAAGAVGQVLVLSLYVSPVPALMGYLIGRLLENKKGKERHFEDADGT